MSRLRQGDIHIFMDTDGGNITVINGGPVMDGGLENAVTLSLFATESNAIWINEYLSGSQALTSNFLEFVYSKPLTVSNLLRCEEFARRDLAWILNEGIADRIEVSVSSTEKNRINLFVGIYADNETLFQNDYEINWSNQRDNPAGLQVEKTVSRGFDFATRVTGEGRIVRITASGQRRVTDTGNIRIVSEVANRRVTDTGQVRVSNIAQ